MTPDLLGPALRTLAGCSGADDALTRIGELLLPDWADWCLLDRLEAPDVIVRVVAATADGPLELPELLGAPAARRSSAQGQGLLRELAEAPRLMRFDAAALAALEATTGDGRLRAQARMALDLGTTDLVVLGLTCRGRLLGVLTAGRTTRRFGEADLVALGDLALLGGLVLDAARLRTVQRSVSTALQTSLLPPLPGVPGLSLAARYVPAGSGIDVGGDWYDAFPLPGDAVALVIGDATGHDVDAAARMAELRNLLRAGAADRDGPPGATLSRLERLTDALGVETAATCCYARLQPEEDGAWRLTWSSAGHLPPLLLTADGATLLDTPADLMLGIDPATPRADHTRVLEPGDVLVLYTDGLVEDRHSALTERLAALVDLAGRMRGSAAERLAEVLVTELPVGHDDVAVLVVRIEPRGPV